ncbi:MaoC family dehydratase N-terminal domain-containing protein [Chloroflexota bacterium]
MSEEPVISEELESLRGVEFGPEVYEIEKGMVRKYAEAIDDPNPRWRQITPPTFPAALVPTELLHKLLHAACPLTRYLNGGNELEYYRAINVGDVISVTSKLDKLRKMEGKEGTTLFMIMEITYTNQRGEVVARGRSTYIRY